MLLIENEVEIIEDNEEGNAVKWFNTDISIEEFPTSFYLLGISKEYAIYICQERAIPQITDGLKTVQRLALWVLRNRAEKIKTIALGGLLAYEKLYVHGDASANKAIGFLAAPYKNNVPLIQGHGQFGIKIHTDNVGAPRYTDVQRSKAAQDLLYVDLDIIPLTDNYDGTNKQPTHFLPLIPLVLLNGVSGIAMGWSTEILPRKLKDLIEATKAVLQNKTIKPLIPFYENFSDTTVINIGENKWELRGKVEISGNTIRVIELPPGLTILNFRKRLIKMENDGIIRSYVDRSTDCIDITITMPRKNTEILENTDVGKKRKLKKIIDPLESEDSAIEFFKIRSRTTERIVVVDWDGTNIVTYNSPEKVIEDFVNWRLGWYTKRYEHRRIRDSYEIMYWQVLKILFENGFTKKLGTFSNKKELQQEIIDVLNGTITLDSEQLEKVVNLPTYKWTKDFYDDIVEKITELKTSLVEYEKILSSDECIRDIYLKELNNLKNLVSELEKERNN